MADLRDTFHADLILKLGGKAKLAEALDLERRALSKWHNRGIPSRYWHRIISIAPGMGIAVTAIDLELTKPTSKARA
jgi:hypothetical protein